MSSQSNIFKGSLYAVSAFFCMAVFGILTKMAYKNDGAIWVSFITYLAGTLLLYPFIASQGLLFFKSQHYSYLLGRAIFGCLASFLYMLSMKYVPIVNATLLFNTAPIFIPLIALLWLKSKISAKVWFAIFIGFIGIVIIIKPTRDIFTQPGNLIALFSGISLAVAYFLIKLLSATDSKLRIIFYYFFVSMLLQIPLLFFAGPFPSFMVCFFSIISGITLVIAQIALVEAYVYADASQVGVFQYSSVVFVGLLDWLIWGVIPSPMELFGVLLVVVAGVIIIRIGNKSLSN